MSNVMEGVRILELAEHTFVPVASAILADWGADVIKIEHAVRGDAMRGLGSTGVMDLSQGVHVLLEHSNRGKRSLGLDLKTPEGLAVFYDLVKTADVFLTNKRPSSLEGLGLGVDDLKKHNPKIIYVRGTAYGPKGPDGDKGGYDMTGFWCRGGSAYSLSTDDSLGAQPGPAYGDSIGGLNIAGGISAALFKRERTGEAPVVDISLLASGMWAMSATIAVSLQMNFPWRTMDMMQGAARTNPLTHSYQCKDGRFICLNMLQAFHYWADTCRHLGHPEWIDDPRFTSHEALSANCGDAIELIEAVIKERTQEEWTEALQSLDGQWAPAQDSLQTITDPQTVANGYVQDVETRDGRPFKLVSSPIQFDGDPGKTERSPEFNEHGDEILQEIGYDMERILELKVSGAVA